jgi:hypothetical protein
MSEKLSETRVHRRPWYRLHVGTWIALILAAVLLVGVNLVGRDLGGYCVHGWPLRYLERDGQLHGDLTVLSDLFPFDEAPVLEFRPLRIVPDVMIAAMILLCYTAATEYWLRTRGRGNRFSLRSLLAFVAFVAVILSLLRSGLLDLCPWDVTTLPVYLVMMCSLLGGAHFLFRKVRRRRRWASE